MHKYYKRAGKPPLYLWKMLFIYNLPIFCGSQQWNSWSKEDFCPGTNQIQLQPECSISGIQAIDPNLLTVCRQSTKQGLKEGLKMNSHSIIWTKQKNAGAAGQTAVGNGMFWCSLMVWIPCKQKSSTANKKLSKNISPWYTSVDKFLMFVWFFLTGKHLEMDSCTTDEAPSIPPLHAHLLVCGKVSVKSIVVIPNCKLIWKQATVFWHLIIAPLVLMWNFPLSVNFHLQVSLKWMYRCCIDQTYLPFTALLFKASQICHLRRLPQFTSSCNMNRGNTA